MNVRELSLVSYLGLSCSLLVPVLRGESFNANGGGFELSSNAWITGVLHICAERLGFQLMPWMWLHCCQTKFSPQFNDIVWPKSYIKVWKQYQNEGDFLCVFVSEVFVYLCRNVAQYWIYVLSAKFPKLMLSIDAFHWCGRSCFFFKLTPKDVFFFSLLKNQHGQCTCKRAYWSVMGVHNFVVLQW